MLEHQASDGVIQGHMIRVMVTWLSKLIHLKVLGARNMNIEYEYCYLVQTKDYMQG